MKKTTDALSDVAIITVSYNSSAQLPAFLESALPCVTHPQQTFIVDNSSTDIEITRALAKKFAVTLIELNDNHGYGGGINRALPHIPSNITTLLISNPDSQLNPEAVSHLRARLCADRNVGVVGPRILNEDGTTYPSGREIPSLRTGIGHALFANIWPSNPWTKKYHSRAYLSDKTQAVGWVSGSCFAIRKDLFNQVGGFDEAYLMYMEDVDLAYRLGQAGFTNLYVPEVSITHLGGESTKAVKKHMLKVHHESTAHFIKVKHPGPLWAPVRGIIKLGLAARLWLQNR